MTQAPNILTGQFAINDSNTAHEYVSAILATLPDQSQANLLRDIIFSSLTPRDWNYAIGRIYHWMPETAAQGPFSEKVEVAK